MVSVDGASMACPSYCTRCAAARWSMSRWLSCCPTTASSSSADSNEPAVTSDIPLQHPAPQSDAEHALRLLDMLCGAASGSWT
jgi:hypothetical protein